MRTWILGVCALALAAGGCATKQLKVAPFESGSTGLPYQLNYTQFTVTAKWRLVGCSPAKVTVEATAVPRLRPDPTARYLLDPSSLEGWFNTTDVKAHYDEHGNFKSLNATIEDKTAETFTAMAKGVTQLITVGSAALNAGGGGTCQALLDQLEKAEIAAKAASENLESVRVSALRIEADPTISERQRRQWLAQTRVELVEREKILAQAVAALEPVQKATIAVETFDWPTHAGEVEGSKRPDAKVLKLWAGSENPQGSDLKLAIERDDGGRAGAGTLDLAKGVPVRLPRPGRLVISHGDAPPVVVKKIDALIVQSGDILYVPVERRPLRGAAASFALHPNGQLESVGRAQKSAPGETLGKMVETAAGQVKILADLDKSDLEKLQDENAELEARKKNADLHKALEPASPEAAELAAINAELTLSTAKLNLYKARQALAEIEQAP